MSPFRAWLKDNGLSLTFVGLFVVCLAWTSTSGMAAYNDTLFAHGLAPVGYARYLGTGNFLSAVFANCQAATLQLGSLILLGRRLYQRGAPHSRKLDHVPGAHGEDAVPASWWYRNSLGLAFAAMFIASFVVHVLASHADYDHTRALSGEGPVDIRHYMLSGHLWFKTMQAWQAEFFAIGAYLILSVFLRQQESPESKPVGASNAATGETNN